MRKRQLSRVLALLLCFCLSLSLLPGAFAAEAGLTLDGETSELDRKVDHAVYGFLTEKASKVEAEGGDKLQVTMIPAGEAEAKTYITSYIYDEHNDLTNTDYVDLLLTECTEGSFCEVLYNEDGQIVDVHQVLDASQVGFDTAQYGGDLTAKGGGSGRMVSKGWIYGMDEENGTITVGDGNHMTYVFEEEYKVTGQTKVFLVDDGYKSEASDLAGVKADYLTKTDAKGDIYMTTDRYVAICVLANDYQTPYSESEVEELYVYKTPYEQDEKYLFVPDDAPNHSDYRENDDAFNKDHMPQGHPEMTSAEPFCLMKDKLYWIGDDEVTCLLLVDKDEQGNCDLTVLDLGWPVSGYQYMRNIEKLGFDPRDVKTLALTHGHADHYGSAYDFVDMNQRAGVDVKVYESKEDTLGYVDFTNDEGADWDIAGALTESTARYIITDFFPEHEWFSVHEGDSTKIYAYLNTGHSTGALSFVIHVEATAEDEFFDEGEKVEFSYMGGYGALAGLNRGYLRNAFEYSLRYIQSHIVPMMEAEADYIYCIPQHTNHYPIIEVNKAYRNINQDKTFGDEDYVPLMACMDEGPDAIINQLEKRQATQVYDSYFQAWVNDPKPIGYASDPLDEAFKVTGTSKSYQTNDTYGPFKRDAGVYEIQIVSDPTNETGTILHGYDAWLNPSEHFKGLTNIDGEDLSKGFVIEKDAYVHDPGGWYVQLKVHVKDGYTGNIKEGTGETKYPGGPVESLQGDGWFEIIRTERLDSKEEAQALLASLEEGKTYTVNLDQASEIQLADILSETIVPEGTAKTLPKAEDIKLDLDDYYGQKIQGYYNFDCKVSDTVTRTAKFYIPAGTVFNQPTVFVGVPNGKDTYEFLVDSGWKALADEKKLHIVLMEPKDKTWGVEADELAYIAALNEDVSYRPFFCAFSSNFYGIGYGESADLLQKHSVNSPKSWASIALIGATGMTADQVTALQAAPSKVPGVSLAQVQTPVWIAADSKTDGVSIMIDFYKSANHSQAVKSDKTYAAEVYLPQEGGTVDDEWCANTVYDTAAWTDCVNKAYSERVYTQLFEGMYRYPGDANGSLRRPGEIFARGFEKFEAKVPGGFQADGSDLYDREWYVYVPERVDTSKPVPLVFVFHGAGGSGNEIADRSGWAQVADEKGFIIVCPTGSVEPSVRNVSDMTTSEYFRAIWNPGPARAERPNDLKFIEYLYDWMVEHYDIDTTRVYASGQSSGGSMTWACAYALPKLFTAAVPVSYVGNEHALTPVESAMIPIKCFVGEQDGGFAAKGFGGDGPKAILEYWTERYDTVQKWDSYTYLNGGQNGSSKEGLFTNYLFSDKDGVPMLECVEVATKTHAIWPSECFNAWDTWFAHYTKDANGVLYYDGKRVGPSSSSGSGGGSSGSTKTETVKNADGSTTKTVTNTRTGTVTATTTWPDGTKEVAETRKDGSVTTTRTEKSGVKTETVTTAKGETTAEVTLPKGVDSAKVTIPSPKTTPGTVAVVVKADGTEAVVKTSVAGAKGVTLTVTGSVKVKLVDNSKAFADVPAGHWAADAVAFATAHELFQGTGADAFSPGLPMTRAMLVTVLHRLEDTPKGGSVSFDDMSGDTWYGEAVAWAASSGIVNGTGDGFQPEADITRESLAAILYRYAKGTAGEGKTSPFADAGDVSGWAKEAMDWAVSQGLITGRPQGPLSSASGGIHLEDGNRLDPAGTATRAEVATILMRYLQSLAG